MVNAAVEEVCFFRRTGLHKSVDFILFEKDVTGSNPSPRICKVTATIPSLMIWHRMADRTTCNPLHLDQSRYTSMIGLSSDFSWGLHRMLLTWGLVGLVFPVLVGNNKTRG